MPQNPQQSGLPPAEISIDRDLLTRLLREQHPDLAGLRLRPLAEGWDNFIYRLGHDLLMRLPRRRLSAGLILHEQQYLPLLAKRLPLPTPVPVRCGRPGAGFPWHWSLVPWLPGTTADLDPLQDSSAEVLANCLATLHRLAEKAPLNPVRGVPLASRAEAANKYLQSLPGAVLTQEITAIWQAGRRAGKCEQKFWLHGDLHPRNILARDGHIAGILDWGDVTGGDPATDLACIWMLFDKPATRLAFSRHYSALWPADAALWQRAAAWACFFAAVFYATGSRGDAWQLRLGRRTFAALQQDANRLLQPDPLVF